MSKKSTKKALLLSALSLFACVAMLIGSTFAWFTDSVTSAGNKIQAGTLQIDLEMLDGGNWVSIKDNPQPIFNYDKWEPGYTDATVLKIVNEGTLALKWMAKFVSDYELTILADVIDVYVKSGTEEIAMPTDRSLDGYTKVGTVADFVNTIEETTNGYLLAGKAAYLGIVLKMQESAGNEYQGLPLCENGGAFDIQILATQYTYEEDSFGSDYDKDAAYPVVDTVVKEDGKAATVGAEGVEVTIPAAAANGNYTIEITNRDETADADGNITLSMDISLKKDGVKIAADGSLYTVEVEVGTEKTVVEVAHNGQPIAFDYDSATGILTFETDSFSPFTFTYSKAAPKVSVTTADELIEALANVTEPTVIDATGVVVSIAGAEHFNIPANVTLKGLTVNANYRGGNYVICGDNVVLENCSFGNSDRNLILAGSAESTNVTANNCSFSGPVIINFHDNQENGEMYLNNCTFTGSKRYDFVEVMGGTHYFNNCTFDYTGVAQSSMGVITAGCFNVYSESDYVKTVAILDGCTRINCGTRKYGAKSTLTIK